MWCSASSACSTSPTATTSVDGGNYEMFDDFVEPALKSVSRVSDDTVAFDLKTPSASLISALTVQSFSIWSAEYAAAMEKAGTQSQVDLAPLGTGPFQLVALPEGQPDPLPRLPGLLGQDGRHAERAAKVDNLSSPSRRMRRCGSPSCARTNARSSAIPIRPTSARCAPRRGSRCRRPRSRRRACCRSASTRSRYTICACAQALAMAIDHDNLVKAVFQGSGVPTGVAGAVGAVGPQRCAEAVPVRSRDARSSCWPRPATPTASRSICGPSRSPAPTCRTAAAPRK